MIQVWNKPLLLMRAIPALEELLQQKQVEVQVPAGPIGFGMVIDFLSILRPLINYRAELALTGLRRPACEGSPNAEFNLKFVSAELVMQEETPTMSSVTLSCGRDSIAARLVQLTNSDRACALGMRWDMLTYLRDHLPATSLTYRLELWRGGKIIKTSLRFYQPAGIATQPTINISPGLYQLIQHAWAKPFKLF